MNPELLKVLVDAGWPEPIGDPWQRVLLWNSYGAVPPSPALHRRHSQKNFKLLLLGPDRKPTHVASVAAAEDPLAELEFGIAATLGSDARLRHLLPAARTASSKTIRVLLNPYIDGHRFDQVEIRMGVRAWRDLVHRIIDAGKLLCMAAESLFPTLLQGHEVISLREEAEADLAALGNIGFTRLALREIESVLIEGATVPAALQHGDFWGGNVLLASGEIRLLDLAEFARVQVPMFDVFSLLTHSHRAAVPWRTTGSADGDSPGVAIARDCAGRQGLEPPQALGALAYYLVSFAAYRLRPGVSRELSYPHLRNVLHLIDLRRRGRDPLQWFSP